jgi:hypothetical protein
LLLERSYRAEIGPYRFDRRSEGALALLLAILLKRQRFHLTHSQISDNDRRSRSAVLLAAKSGRPSDLSSGWRLRESWATVGLSSPFLVPLENVVNGGGSAAVMPGNTGNRFTLRIACRNGIPFALRDF